MTSHTPPLAMAQPAAPNPNPAKRHRPDDTAPAQVPSDADLMRAVAQGDETAFATLFERHLPSVINTLYRYTMDRDAAEDLAQVAFLRVFKAAGRYRADAKFTTWLYCIVTHLALNWRRNERRRRGVSLDAPRTEAGGGDDSLALQLADPATAAPEGALELSDLSAAVSHAMSKLPETQRLALILHRFQHLSYLEIGQTLNMSADAVKSLLARARSNLKEALAPFWSRLQRELEGED